MKNFSFKRMTAWLLAFLMFAGVMPANAAASGFEDFLNDVIGYGKFLAAGADDEMAARGAAMAAAAGYSLATDKADSAAPDTSEAETASDEAVAADADSTLTASLTEAKTYTDALTINNASNDPATVVKNFKTHFTWDNEKREGSKDYLFDWSYYNGVVFEGIEYLYEVTGETVYKDYVVEYMSSLINEDGTWATCTNSDYTKTECAGYDPTHGADCYKTASLLLDAYAMTGDNRYLTRAEKLYADLDTAAGTINEDGSLSDGSYLLKNAGYNYRHTWASDPSPDLWLDGLYMILPFRAEYAKHIGDTEELDLIVDRMQWVSDNMYNSSKGLFYHGADSATSNSGTYWLRSIGWYAAAMADVMDSMEGENLEAMKTQLKKLVDGMKACQNASNGMWLNNMAESQSSTNPYETSGTALVCYAVMKAVNNGWLDESYADMAILAFNGICNEKLSGNTLTDICFKGVPKGANSTYYDNEGKGVGPFIMLYAEVLEYVQNAERVTVTYVDELLSIQASAAGLTDITAENVTGDVDLDAYCLDYIMYDIALEGYTAGDRVFYSIRYLDDMDSTNPVVYRIENGVPVAIDFELVTDVQGNKYVEFTANSDGIFAYGALNVPEGYALNRIEITDIYNDQYLAEDAVDLSDIRVIAVYTKTGAEDFIRVLYNEHDVANLEELQMSVPGTKTVTIVFENCTDTYEINVHQKHFADENAEGTAAQVVVEIPAIGILTSLSVTEVEDTAAIEETLTGVLEGDIVAFDITAEGFVNGENTVSVTVPIPDGMDAAKFAVYHVDGSSYTRMPGSASEGGTKYTFTTDHFSVYVGGEAAPASVDENNKVEGSSALTTAATYEYDDDGVDSGASYLIVRNGYALRNGTNGATTSSVTITGNYATFQDDTQEAASVWTFVSDGDYWDVYNTSGTTRYIYLGSSAVLSTNQRDNLLVEENDNGTVVIRRDGSRRLYLNGTTYSASNSYSTNFYLYKYTPGGNGATVTFKASPATVTMLPKTTQAITYEVLVGGESALLNPSTDITWGTSDDDVATVTNGVITANADGTATITATLKSVNGTALQENIVLPISVTVASKQIVPGSEELSGTNRIEVDLNGTPNYSNIKYTVKYDDNTSGLFTVGNGLTVGECDTSTSGIKTVDIMYNGSKIGTVNVKVTVNFDKLEDADMDQAPQYPADGAVRIDKTAKQNADTLKNTGVTEVELAVAGVSVKRAVNVILISDISNSMSWDDTKYDYNDTAVTEGTNQRLNLSKAAAKTFVNELLEDNADKSEEFKNTVTLLAFAGIDGDYNDHSTAAANDDVYRLGDLAMTTISEAEAAIDQLVKATTGGTNYDYAFQQAYALAERLYAENGNEVYIVFMTDGVPTHYNGVYYKSRSNTDLTALMNYIDPTTGESSRYTSTGNDRNGNDIDSTATQSITVYYNDGTTAAKTVTYNKGWSDYVMNNKNGWAEKTKGLDYVAKVYSVGFGMRNGSVTQGATTSMPTLNNVNGGQYYIPSSTTEAVLKHVASTPTDYYSAEDEAGLKALYSAIATQIKFAGREAQANDTIGNNFTLQMAAKSGSGDKTATLADFGITPAITVKTYDLYTKAEVQALTAITDEVRATLLGNKIYPTINDIPSELNDEVKHKLIGLRKIKADGLYVESLVERVTFNEDGSAATSNLLEAANIMSTADGTVTIEAKYFTYKKTSAGVETFEWNIGNITDKEITLSFYVYLKGALEGGRPEAIYYTNEEAMIHYIDINDKHAMQVFPVPGVAWGGATTTIHFYLVNEKGQPVNRNGDVVPLANRIVVGNAVVEKLNLNADSTIDAQTIEAAAYVPSDYYLYDINASYVIQTASGDENTIIGGITPSVPSVDAYKVTPDGKTQTGAQTTVVIDHEDTYYTWSLVGFGVRQGLTLEETTQPLVKDQVVVDYGVPVRVNVLANDPNVAGYQRTLSGFVQYNPNTDTKIKQLNAGSQTYDDTYGTFAIVDGVVQFTLKKFISETERVFYVAKYENTENTADYYYLFGELDIIPATTIYYEETFVTFTDSEIEAYTGNITVSDQSYTIDVTKTNTEYIGKYIVDGTEKTGIVSITTDGNGAKSATVEIDGSAIIINDFTQTGIWYDLGTYGYTNADGDFISEVIQAEDRPKNGNVYGYDGINSTSKTYSLGSAMGVTVNRGLNNVANAAKAEFTFTGTGFDIISLTNSDSGLLLVTITDESGTVVAKHFIDNYYGFEYKDVDGDKVNDWVPITTTEGQYPYQVPVIKKNLTYGTYTVTLQVAYSGAFEHNSDTKYSFVLDSIRIYDPANPESDAVIKDAYINDNEYKPAYTVLRDALVNVEDLLPVSGAVINGTVFVDGNSAEVLENYEDYGPNNEVYLAGAQGITFKISVTNIDADKKPSVYLGAKLAFGTTADLYIGGTKFQTIETATDMYYDITEKVVWDEKETTGNTYVSEPIIISNGAEGLNNIISLTNIKVAQGTKYQTAVDTASVSDVDDGYAEASVAFFLSANSAEETYTSVELIVDNETVEYAKEVFGDLYGESAEDTGFKPEYMDYMIKLKKSGRKTTEYVLVITSEDVNALTINGEDVERVRKASNVTSVFGPDKKIEATLGIDLDADDYIMWLYAVNSDQDYEIIAYNADGEASSVVSTGEAYSTASLRDYNGTSKDVLKIMRELAKKNFKPEKLEAKINKMLDGGKQLVVEVSDDVEYIIANGEIIRNYITETFVDLSRDGAETEKRIFIADLNNEDTVEVTAYNEEGVASSSENAEE